MTIYQPSSDTLWEFWQARKVNGQWQACWGGCMRDVSKSQGIWQKPYGTTATGLAFMGGQITAEELQRGEIRHVLGIALVDTEKWSVVSYPANRSDGYNPKDAPNRIPEGLRFRLDPAVDLDALKMHPVGKTIAKAAQKYGFVVWDKAGAITLRAQNPKSYTRRDCPILFRSVQGNTGVRGPERLPVGASAIPADGLRQTVSGPAPAHRRPLGQTPRSVKIVRQIRAVVMLKSRATCSGVVREITAGGSVSRPAGIS